MAALRYESLINETLCFVFIKRLLLVQNLERSRQKKTYKYVCKITSWRQFCTVIHLICFEQTSLWQRTSENSASTRHEVIVNRTLKVIFELLEDSSYL